LAHTNNKFIENFLFVVRPIKTDMTSKAKGGTQQKMGFFQQCDQQGLLSIQQPTGGLCPHLTRLGSILKPWGLLSPRFP
jgi:hypothetical protein